MQRRGFLLGLVGLPAAAAAVGSEPARTPLEELAEFPIFDEPCPGPRYYTLDLPDGCVVKLPAHPQWRPEGPGWRNP